MPSDEQDIALLPASEQEEPDGTAEAIDGKPEAGIEAEPDATPVGCADRDPEAEVSATVVLFPPPATMLPVPVDLAEGIAVTDALPEEIVLEAEDWLA